MKLYSWGSNSHGQLGQGTNVEQYLHPVLNRDFIKPKYIVGGGKHTILLASDGEIFSSGDNDKGQLGEELVVKLINTFQQLNFIFKIAKISCGWDFNVALTENGEVFAWGSNSFGQLGLSISKVKYLSSAVRVFEKQVVDIGAGLRHSAIVTSDKQVFTSGFGRKGQLGFLINDEIPSVTDKFTLVGGIKDCEEISCGECHCVAKTSNGKFFSWGNNKYGQLGLDPGSVSHSSTPVQIVMFTEIFGTVHLVSGWAHNFILTDKGQLVGWGRNDFGQLGEKREFSWKPELMKNPEKIKQICLGSHHSVALTENGEVFTWGWNEHGNCGNKSCNNVLQPFKLAEFSNVKLIGSGAAHSFLCL